MYSTSAVSALRWKGADAGRSPAQQKLVYRAKQQQLVGSIKQHPPEPDTRSAGQIGRQRVKECRLSLSVNQPLSVVQHTSAVSALRRKGADAGRSPARRRFSDWRVMIMSASIRPNAPSSARTLCRADYRVTSLIRKRPPV